MRLQQAETCHLAVQEGKNHNKKVFPLVPSFTALQRARKEAGMG